MFLCIEELTWNEAMNVTRVFYWNPGCVMFHSAAICITCFFHIPFESDARDE